MYTHKHTLDISSLCVHTYVYTYYTIKHMLVDIAGAFVTV